MKAKISDWQLFNSSRSSTKSWRKVNPSQSVLGCYLSVLVSSCPGVLVPACVDIVWAGYGTPWPGLDYHKEWGWLAAYKKDARQTRQHTLGHTRALIFPVCVFLKGGDASNIEQPFEMTTIRSAARQGGRGSLIAVHYAVGICALGTQCYCLKRR